MTLLLEARVAAGYLDLDLRVEETDGRYRADVTSSPCGEASTTFELPFTHVEFENVVLRARAAGGFSRSSPQLDTIKEYGQRLYDAVFAEDVRMCFRRSIDAAATEGKGLRVRIHLGHGGRLDNLPWEYLYSRGLGRFIVLSSDTPLVRYIDLTHRPEALMVTPPLRLLVVIASPRELPALDVAGEWTRLQSALGGMEQSGHLALHLLAAPTIESLQRTLWASEYNILHFVGHGTFDDTTRDGRLLFEHDDRSAHAVSGEYLGTLLHDHHTMRLVTINACEGARTSAEDPYAGVAQSLVRQGIPAVVAMQFVITDQAAVQFASTFYAAVAEGTPVDACLTRARKAILGSGNEIEWGIPVLYSRSPDGRVFDFAAGAPKPQPQPLVEPPIEDRPELTDTRSQVPEEARAEPEPSFPRAPAARSATRLPLIVGAAIAALVVVVASFAIFGGGTSPSSTVVVPDVTGLAEDEAGAALQQEGLTFTRRLIDRSDAGDLRPGAVVRTIPRAGEAVAKGTAVQMLVVPPDDAFPTDEGVPTDERPPTDDGG